MRIMAIDYGDARTGIALTDSLNITVYGLETIDTKKEKEFVKARDRKLLKRIEEIIQEYNVEQIVIGIPYNENGTEGERAKITKEFKHKLKCKFSKIPIFEEDERYTSIEANTIMLDMQIKSRKKKGIIDQLAAVNILNSYIKRNNTQ